VLHLQPLAGARRLGRHVDHVAFHVEFPAVIEAAQAAFLVAAEGERRPAVRAELAQHAEAALGIAEDDEVFPEQPGADRRAVPLRHFLGHARRQPVPAHHLAHRGFALDAAQQLVLLSGQHGYT
jgi:hypothetical protein